MKGEIRGIPLVIIFLVLAIVLPICIMTALVGKGLTENINAVRGENREILRLLIITPSPTPTPEVSITPKPTVKAVRSASASGQVR